MSAVVPATAPAVPVVAPRFPLLVPLRRGDFALCWAGNAVSLAGEQFQAVALAVLFMLVGGVVADRFRPRQVMLGANLVQGLLVVGLVVALAGGMAAAHRRL